MTARRLIGRIALRYWRGEARLMLRALAGGVAGLVFLILVAIVAFTLEGR
jgi:hypothetical protein